MNNKKTQFSQACQNHAINDASHTNAQKICTNPNCACRQQTQKQLQSKCVQPFANIVEKESLLIGKYVQKTDELTW